MTDLLDRIRAERDKLWTEFKVLENKIAGIDLAISIMTASEPTIKPGDIASKDQCVEAMKHNKPDKPYPRTCPTCGLGPCRFSFK